MPHSPDAVLSILTKGGITAFFGVPDSTLNGFGHLILQPQKEVVGAVCSSEGSAVAEAIGHFLASGQPACVYMQNSGLTNALNPLSSLAHHDVFGIPVLLLVGWRGFPGTPDEPQHLVMGKSTIDFLENMSIPTYVMREDASRDVEEAVEHVHRANGPVALLVPPGVIGSLNSGEEKLKRLSVQPIEFVEAVVEAAHHEAFYFSATGFSSRLLMACAQNGLVDQSRVFPLLGGMGHTFAVAARFALTRPDLQVVCLDGDGSLLMHTGALARASELSTTRLLHIALNNGTHQSVGGHPTIAPDCDFGALAGIFGFKDVVTCSSPHRLRQIVSEMTQAQGARFVEVKLASDPSMKLPRPASTPSEMLHEFRMRVHEH